VADVQALAGGKRGEAAERLGDDDEVGGVAGRGDRGVDVLGQAGGRVGGGQFDGDRVAEQRREAVPEPSVGHLS
jgi:hypothetical protein